MANPFRILLVIETDRTYGRKLLQGISKYAQLNGPWDIELQAPFYLQPTHRVGDFRFNHVADFDGIIMREQKNMESLFKAGIPLICISYLTPYSDIPTIRPADEEIAVAAAKYYLERGYKNFAFVGYDGLFWSDNRKTTFANFVTQAGFSCYTYTQPKTKKQRQWHQEAELLSDWLQKLPKPVGVMACNDERATQVLKACQFSNLAVPEELAILGVDNDEFLCTLSSPSISSVSLNLEVAGFEAASILDRVMRGEKIQNSIKLVRVRNIVTRISSNVHAISEPVVAQSINFIRKHIKKPIQIDDIVKAVLISRRSLQDKFKASMGISIYKYIKKLRQAWESVFTNT